MTSSPGDAILMCPNQDKVIRVIFKPHIQQFNKTWPEDVEHGMHKSSFSVWFQCKTELKTHFNHFIASILHNDVNAQIAWRRHHMQIHILCVDTSVINAIFTRMSFMPFCNGPKRRSLLSVTRNNALISKIWGPNPHKNGDKWKFRFAVPQGYLKVLRRFNSCIWPCSVRFLWSIQRGVFWPANYRFVKTHTSSSIQHASSKKWHFE
jgi:hypothetical protein